MSQTPTVGRIVLYTLTEADLRAPSSPMAGAGNMPHAGEEYAATVVRAFNGGVVNLRVHLDGLVDLWATSRYEGTEPGTWRWPPRV